MKSSDFIVESAQFEIPAQIDSIIKQVRDELAITDKSDGMCDMASVLLWRKIGSPKDFPPTVVEVEDQENLHVVLLNKNTRLVIDPTGDQFSLPVGVVGYDGVFSRAKRIPLSEISEIETQIKQFKIYRGKEKSKPAIDIKKVRARYDLLNQRIKNALSNGIGSNRIKFETDLEERGFLWSDLTNAGVDANDLK